MACARGTLETRRDSSCVRRSLCLKGAVEPRTQLRREALWAVFLRWLDLEGIEKALFLETDGWVDIDAINVVLSRYGRSLYEAGRPYSHYSETINCLSSKVPKLRRMLQPAWDTAFAWKAIEPGRHHTAMPWQILLALISLAWAWGWPRVAAVLALAWGGLLRIGEVVMARRKDLLLLQDVGETIDFILILDSGAKDQEQGSQAPVGQDRSRTSCEWWCPALGACAPAIDSGGTPRRPYEPGLSSCVTAFTLERLPRTVGLTWNLRRSEQGERRGLC